MSARGLVLTLALVAAGAAPAFAQKSTAVLPGASSKEPVSIDAGKLDYFDKDQKLVYSGAEGGEVAVDEALAALLAVVEGDLQVV